MESEVGGEVNGAGKSLGSKFGKMFALAGAGLAAAGIGSFLKDSIGEAREAQKVGALTASVIKATGGAAQITAKQVGDLAGALSLKTGIDDEVIQSGENMLLTFKNIKNEAGAGNDIFNQTTKTLVDMSAAMGTEPKQAAIQLGKALNDPIKGVSALSRVGVTFTEGQKEQIKTLVESGKTMDAQKIVLRELNSEFGGAAAAQATAGEKAAVAFGNLKEQIGTALLPVVDKVANVLSGRVIPAISGFIAGLTSGKGAGGVLASAMGVVRAVLADVATVLTGTLLPSVRNLWAALSPTLSEAFNIAKGAAQSLIVGIQALGPALLAVTGFINAHKTAITAVVLTVGTAVLAWKAWQFAIAAWAAITKTAAAVQAAFNVVMAANPIGLVVVALAALAVGLIYAYKHSETFRNVIDGVFGFLKTAVVAVIGFVTDHWQLIVSIIGGPLVAVGILVVQHWGAIKDSVMSAVDAVIDFVRDHWRLIITIIGGPLGLAVALVTKYWSQIKAATQAVWNAVKSVISAQVNAAKAVVSAAIGAIKAAFGGLASLVGAVRGWFAQVLAAIKDKLGQAVAFVKTIPGKVSAALGDLGNYLYAKGQALIQGLIDGIKSKIADVGSAVSGIAGKIKGYLPGSPVKEGPLTSWNKGGAGERLMGLLAKGLTEGTPEAEDAAKNAAEKIQEHFDKLRSHLEGVRDGIKSTLDGLKSDFASLRDSISSAFMGDPFEAATGADMFKAGVSTMENLGALKRALKKLRGWNIDPEFLSSLFASGNSALILDLASGPAWQAKNNAGLFETNTNLSQQLGAGVARNELGPKIDRTNQRLERIENHLKNLPKHIGKEINGAAAAGHKGRAA